MEDGDKERAATQMAPSEDVELLMATAGSGRDPWCDMDQEKMPPGRDKKPQWLKCMTLGEIEALNVTHRLGLLVKPESIMVSSW